MNALHSTSADAAILDAFEKVRSLRAYAYSFDDLPDGERPDAATQETIEAADAEMADLETVIYDGSACTIEGILARLQLVIPGLDQSRWVDRTLMERGLPALWVQSQELELGAQQVALAARDLANLAWTQALEAYEASSQRLADALELLRLADEERLARRKEGNRHEFTETLAEAIGFVEGRLAGESADAIRNLLRTPSPDWKAYQRKAEIAVKEGFANEAGEWLLRDVNSLLGAQAGEA